MILWFLMYSSRLLYQLMHYKLQNQFTTYFFLILGLIAIQSHAQNSLEGTQIAFLADVHLQDLYGTLKDSDYKGVLNPKNGQYTLLRTMESQLHSTRIFNENYFAFLAALDDIARRGVKYVALPGDYSDDGQPLHVRGLQHILQQYSEKYGIEFFITTGNHDPVGPFAQQAGKNDFLGKDGKRQPIFSTANSYQPNGNDELPVVVSSDISKMGYLGITDYLKDFGFFPKKNYQFWSTPFTHYTTENYTYEKAVSGALLPNRSYEVLPGFSVPDASYLVEPVEGLWLLAIDGNVYIPKNNKNNPADPKNYSGADLGYNNVLSNKKHLISWVQNITIEAERRGKTLIAFSHFPMVEFNDDASTEIEKLMGTGKWQLDRVPDEKVAQAFADAGLKIHFAGHMHINDTGIHTTQRGNTIVNIQTPSLAAYIPAYKLLTIRAANQLEIETITVDKVPRFNELFDLYKMEYSFLKRRHAKDLWDNSILQTKSYHEFTDWHLKELVRLRFLPDDWPVSFKDFLISISGKDLLLIANMESSQQYDSLLKDRLKFKHNWDKAEVNAKKELKQNSLKAPAFRKWSGMDMVIDFYRIRSAGQLAINDIGLQRIKQYRLLIQSFLKNQDPGSLDPLAQQLGLFLSIFNKFLNGAPSDHFSIDLKSGIVKDLSRSF